MTANSIKGAPVDLLRPLFGSEVCIALYFMTIMAPWSVTTTGSYTVLSAARNVLLLLLVIASGVVARSRLSDSSTGVAMVCLISLFGLGTLLAFISGAIALLDFSEVAAMLITVFGCIVLSVDAERLSPRKLLWPIVAFCFLVLVFSVQSGGMTLGVPIKLDLSFAESDYTLSGAAFWALATLFTISLLTFERNVIVRCVLFSFAMFSALATASFGARGETIALIVVAGVFLFRRNKIVFAGLFAALALLLQVASQSGLIEEFTLYARILEVQGGYFGLRDQLLEDAFGLLSEKPLCLVTGCGFAYFQWFYGYPYSFYVHNQLVESLIVFGMPLTFFFLSLTVFGAWRLRRVSLFDRCLVYVMGFAFVTALKSGSIEGSLLLLPLCFFCISGAVRPSARILPVLRGDAERVDRQDGAG